MKVVKSKVGGIKPGDCLYKINGCLVEDILDVKYNSAEPPVIIEYKRNGILSQLRLEKNLGPQSLVFKNSVKKLKKCNNKCIFCFIDQLPKGLRPALYVKDDDYRLSLLYGNFVTLTNLSKREMDKIVEYNISPLYVSLHTTNKDVRQELFGCREKGLENFTALAKKGIRFHVQIVLIPEVNDGKVLQETLCRLTGMEDVLSIGVVPAAKTKFSSAKFRSFNKGDALDAIELSQDFERTYLADEIFILGGEVIPPAGYYGDFPQLENGIGLIRQFLDTFKGFSSNVRATLLTGELSPPILKEAFKNCPNISVLPVANSLFGKTVTVAGLLAGADFQKVIKDLDGLVFLPDVALNANGLFLDDVKIEDIKLRPSTRLQIAPSTGKALRKRLEELS